jgi:hypothetical protein
MVFQVIHIKLPKAQEKKTKRIAKIMFRFLTMLSKDLRTFLGSRGLLKGKSKKIPKDCKEYLYALKKLTHLLNKNGKSNAQIIGILMDAIRGRNGICHHNLPDVSKNWKLYLKSWMEVCILIGAKETPSKIKRVRRFLKKTSSVPRLKSDASANSVFRKLEKNSNLTSKWTATKEYAAIFLANVFFDLSMDIYWPELEKFLNIHGHQPPTSVIDCHAMTEIIKMKFTAADFRTSYGETHFDMSHVENAADGRHSACHDRYTKILSNWENYIDSMNYVLKGMASRRAARIKIKTIRRQLLRARDRARRQVTKSINKNSRKARK